MGMLCKCSSFFFISRNSHASSELKQKPDLSLLCLGSLHTRPAFCCIAVFCSLGRRAPADDFNLFLYLTASYIGLRLMGFCLGILGLLYSLAAISALRLCLNSYSRFDCYCCWRTIVRSLRYYYFFLSSRYLPVTASFDLRILAMNYLALFLRRVSYAKRSKLSLSPTNHSSLLTILESFLPSYCQKSRDCWYFRSDGLLLSIYNMIVRIVNKYHNVLWIMMTCLGQ